jgi:2-oxoglutarate ferredoxin oxidoreductase subunit beta
VGKITKTSPLGAIDYPFNPVSLALGAEATFVARTIDMDRDHTTEMLQRAYDHQGAAFIEIYQNCNVFNDKAFIELTGRETRDHNRINLVQGEPVTFGPNDENGVVIEGGRARIVKVADVGLDAIWVHDAFTTDPAPAFALSRLSHGPHGPTPVGVFRQATRETYEEVMLQQLAEATEARGPGDLAKLVASSGTWTVD